MNVRASLAPLVFGCALVVALFATVASPLAHAQSLPLPTTDTSGLGSIVVNEAEVRDRAFRAFDATVENRLDAAIEARTARSQPANAYRALAETIKEDFRLEILESLERLKGDGVLDAAEVVDEFGDERSALIDELNNGFDALREGAPPQPLRPDFDSDPAYTSALLRYTFGIRNTGREWLWFLGTFAASLLAAWLINWLLHQAADRFRRRGAMLRAKTISALDAPLCVLVALIGLAQAIEFIWIPGVAKSAVHTTFFVLTWLPIIWLAWSVCVPLSAAITRLFQRTYHQPAGEHFTAIIQRALRIGVVLCGLAIIAKVIGGAGLTGTLAGLGLLGVGVALILKGTFEQVVASFTIFGDRPFVIGDMLEYEGKWGVAEDIGLRSTRFRALDGEVITIPNDELIEKDIINLSARRWVRERFRLSLVYGTTPDQMRKAIEIVKDILDDAENQHPNHPPRVEFVNFGAYDLQLLVQYCYKNGDYWAAKAYASTVNLAILDRFEEAGLTFAFPTTTNLLTTNEDGRPELVVHESSGSDQERQASKPEQQSNRNFGNQDGGQSPD